MKRFEFKLEALLNYKRHLEQIARREMAVVAEHVNRTEAEIQALRQDRHTAIDTLGDLVEKGVDAAEFKRHHDFIATVEQMIVIEKRNKAELEKRLNEKRAVLKQRTIDKKAIERLKEKQAEAYLREMLREEQKGLDEMSSIKTAREAMDGNV